MTVSLRRCAVSSLPDIRREPVEADAAELADTIFSDVVERGDAAVREWAVRYGDLSTPGAPLVVGPERLQAAWRALPDPSRQMFRRTAARIRAFADAQAAALGSIEQSIPGGRVGLRYSPVERAGCYAPGGRFPLPSSVLMTGLTAVAAGVPEVWVASPRPALETLAAAHLVGAKGVVCIGGAQAIAALSVGTETVPAVDCIVGPGNRWVTAAKQRVAGRVRIDMLAGPSELVVLADDAACPDVVAADLLAQAEHDPDALPIVVTPSARLADEIDRALQKQLSSLPTADIARKALAGGFCVLVEDLIEGCAVCDRLAPEHLAIHVAQPETVRSRLKHYGALFIGAASAEALGDYGAGPNHVLPTGGTARSMGALSVVTFLRVQTWLHVEDLQSAQQLVADATMLARVEGLEAHARSAAARLTSAGEDLGRVAK